MNALDTLAAALCDSGRHAEALELFEEVAELWPEPQPDPEIHTRHGNCLRRLARFTEAEALLLEAESLHDRAAPALSDTRRALLELYVAWENPVRAAEYRRLLADRAEERDD